MTKLLKATFMFALLLMCFFGGIFAQEPKPSGGGNGNLGAGQLRGGANGAQDMASQKNQGGRGNGP